MRAANSACVEQLRGNLELRRERILFGLDLGIGQETRLSSSNRMVM